MAADAPRFFSVWLVKSNVTYSGVPFTVVCDWIQEGRLTESDCVRTPGQPSWDRLGDTGLFKPYFMMGSSVPTAEDVAEAQEAIDLEMPKKKEWEDEEVDMIPLIDISMVLLVFFMMTANELLTQSPVENPKVKNSSVISLKGEKGVAIRKDPVAANKLVYYLDNDFSQTREYKDVIDAIQKAKDTSALLKVVIQADGGIPFDKIQQLTMELDQKEIKYVLKVKNSSGE